MFEELRKKYLASKPAEILRIANFIDGQFRAPAGGHFLDSMDPSTGRPWAKICDSDHRDADAAVRAAQRAYETWSKTTPSYRSKILQKIADLVEKYGEDLARFESKDQGKPVSLAQTVDIPRCATNFRFFSTAFLHQTNKSSIISEPTAALNYVKREPLGVAALISPWNLPLYLLSFKIAPALISGNTVVAKPSEMTSVTAWMLAKIFIEAGLPNGVVNFVFGTGPKVGEALVKHPDVRLVSFTGSTMAGRLIAEKSAPLNKKLSLEMGGKNACIVFDDVDFKHIPTIVRSCFANQGEICLCSSRIFVQKGIFDKFIKDFVYHTKNLRVGLPTDPKSDLGALVSAEHLAKVTGFVAEARAAGALVLCGDEPPDPPTAGGGGYFMRPTVVTDVPDSARIMQEEIFGPVVCVTAFDTEVEVIRRANDVKFGLSASVWSKSVDRLTKVSHGLEVGTVWCNCWMVRDLNMPFGGTKASGMGREGAEDSINFFTERKTICMKID